MSLHASLFIWIKIHKQREQQFVCIYCCCKMFKGLLSSAVQVHWLVKSCMNHLCIYMYNLSFFLLVWISILNNYYFCVHTSIVLLCRAAKLQNEADFDQIASLLGASKNEMLEVNKLNTAELLNNINEENQ